MSVTFTKDTICDSVETTKTAYLKLLNTVNGWLKTAIVSQRSYSRDIIKNFDNGDGHAFYSKFILVKEYQGSMTVDSYLKNDNGTKVIVWQGTYATVDELEVDINNIIANFDSIN